MSAPAKINLLLKVLGRRTDGYHDLRTTMVSVRLYDSLQFDVAPPGCVSLICRMSGRTTPEIPVDDRNLILQAARLLQSATGCSQGIAISLWKRIPSEAGLGGGSSDAAATLMGLNQFWNLQLQPARLHELAAQLGSDVNFFLDSPSAATCTGRGEKIAAIPLAGPLHVVVIKPSSGLSTAQVFQQWSRESASTGPALEESPREQGVAAQTLSPTREVSRQSGSHGSIPDVPKMVIENDLTGPARTLNAEIDQVLSRLHRENVLGSGMTGSGSACFALCRTARQARTLAGRCRNWRLGQVFVVSSGI